MNQPPNSNQEKSTYEEKLLEKQAEAYLARMELDAAREAYRAATSEMTYHNLYDPNYSLYNSQLKEAEAQFKKAEQNYATKKHDEEFSEKLNWQKSLEFVKTLEYEVSDTNKSEALSKKLSDAKAIEREMFNVYQDRLDKIKSNAQLLQARKAKAASKKVQDLPTSLKEASVSQSFKATPINATTQTIEDLELAIAQIKQHGFHEVDSVSLSIGYFPLASREKAIQTLEAAIQETQEKTEKSAGPKVSADTPEPKTPRTPHKPGM